MKPALKIEPAFRSALEKKVAGQLDDAGVAFNYEGRTLHFNIPARVAKYTPDFPIDGTPIVIEAKGHFGGIMGRTKEATEARQRLILVKEQHPELDIRIVFQRAANKIYPKSKTTYGQWATDHGFPWSDKGIVPATWIKEMKGDVHDDSGASASQPRKRPATDAASPKGSRVSRKG